MTFLDTIKATPPRRQAVMAAAAMIPIAALLIAVYVFVLRKPYEPLFTSLRPSDAATIVADLDKKKIPYRLADGGSTVLVPKDKVDATRLSVASEDLPLKGVVGFELFNKSDMGLTEFAQRINYQRALQGELARTMMAMEEIDTARVHLSMAEPTIFRDDRRPSKASISLTVRPGKTLSPDAVRGIQRLVAAAVPELDPANVVVLDDQGRIVSSDSLPADTAAPAVKAVEQVYVERITRALEKLYPSGSFRVDVRAGAAAAQSGSDAAAGPAAEGAEPGRSFPLSVAVTLSAPLAAQSETEIRALVNEALGADATLGDSISVSGSPPFAETPTAAAAPPAATPWRAGLDLGSPRGFWTILLLPTSLLLAGAAVVLHRRQPAPRRLSDRQREAYVRRLRAVLDQGELNALPPL